MPDLGPEISIVFEPVIPPDPSMIGFEAIMLAQKFALLEKDEVSSITAIVREGFEHNFATESSPDGAWKELAEWTQEEREQLGYDPEHPILVRSGEYKASWIDRGHGLHLEEVDYQQGEGWSGIGVVEIIVGSKDPRVPLLAGGSEIVTAGMFADSEVSDIADEFGGARNVPPRPAHILASEFERRIANKITFILNEAAEETDLSG